MSVVEKYWNDGCDAGVSRIIELIKSGLSPDDALRKLNEERVA